MIIGFWSEKPGNGSVTHNMIASGISMSMNYEKNVILMQAKADYNRLDYAFLPYLGDSVFKEDYGYYNFGGIDSVINKMENGVYNNSILYNEIIKVKNSNLHYLPSTRKGGGELFNIKVSNILSEYLEDMKKTKDIVLIELCNGFEYISKELLNRFDVLVVNISQDNKSLEDIRNNNMIMEKSIFAIGRYDDSSQFNLKNISRKYGICEERVGVVPYNIKYKDSVCQGKCMEFFERHYNSKKEDDEYVFMRCVKNMSEIIMQKGRQE